MLISVIGDVGSGKTLFATYIASKDERPVYSNYNIKIPNYRELHPETLATLKNEPALVIIDEAYSWLESRLSGRPINLFMSYILFQSRKRDLEFILTDQLVGTIDLRYRLMTNYEVFAINSEEGFDYYILKKSRYRKYNPIRKFMPYSVAETIFPLYDSWQLINPIDENLLANVSVDKTDIVSTIDKVKDELLAKAPANKYTKGIIADYCLRNGIPKMYVDMIFHAIKANALNNS